MKRLYAYTGIDGKSHLNFVGPLNILHSISKALLLAKSRSYRRNGNKKVHCSQFQWHCFVFGVGSGLVFTFFWIAHLLLPRANRKFPHKDARTKSVSHAKSNLVAFPSRILRTVQVCWLKTRDMRGFCQKKVIIKKLFSSITRLNSSEVQKCFRKFVVYLGKPEKSQNRF